MLICTDMKLGYVERMLAPYKLRKWTDNINITYLDRLNT